MTDIAITSTSNDYYAGVPSHKEQTDLGKDEFLKILIAQLNHQDPLNPMEDQDFIAQMAQFSSLEQMLSMNESIKSMLEHQTQSNFAQYSQLIGKQVSWSGDNNAGIVQGEGVVQSVSIKDGNVHAEMEDGTRINTSLINKVENKGDE